jgi:hypothetical protein
MADNLQIHNSPCSESDKEFFKQIGELLAAARKYARKQLDSTITATNFEIGRRIVEREQQGQKRAKYGTRLLEGLSEFLTEIYGRGYSVVNLKNMRKFYQVYSSSIRQTLSAESENPETDIIYVTAPIGQTLSAQFKLTWSHYQFLMRIDDADIRHFYEIESESENWGIRELARQYNSSLYERLALSRNKDKIMELAKEGQIVENPRDIFKSPYVLEFTGLEQRTEYSESELEQALIDNL